MATLNPENLFQSWILTDEEFVQGSILTITQKQCIQNQIAQLAQEKINLTYNPENPNRFLQREAELQGSITALQYLLTLSNTAEQKLSGIQDTSGSSNGNGNSY